VHLTWSYNNGNVVAIINETTSDSSVSFYKMPVDILFKNASQQQNITVSIEKK